ncbi:MAG: DnaJ C-terminal domain-containing protein [Actinomycetota bacterium]|nr:DnaJ C-terminal domain-containing protein [Actinomycetota bacterium]
MSAGPTAGAEDLYEVLGVSPQADDKQITKAYRKLAREHHPDANPDDPGAEDRFKRISAAYEVLGDPEKRKKYDDMRRFGGNPFGGGAGGPGGAGPDGFGGIRFEDLDFGDILSQMFGGMGGGGAGRRGGARTGPRRGADVTASFEMAFEDAVRGTETTLLLDDGSGQRSVKVRIPAGVANGQTIRIPGRGAAGRDGGPSGDLFVEVKVRPHRHFRRSGNDLTITVPVTFAEAALGADIKVPTLSGKPVTVRIPAGTSSGRTLRVRGQGVETKSAKGDLLVTVAVHVPQKLSDTERELIEQLAEAERGRPSPRDDLGVGS